MSFGIALSGGGARGAAHVGVMCALEEAGMLPSSVSGTSAGSIIAGLYAVGMTAGEMKEKVIELANNSSTLVDGDYVGILGSIVQLFRGNPIRFSGFLKGDKLERYLEGLTAGKNISALKMRTVLTAVDLYSRKTIAYVNSLNGVSQMKNVVWKTDIKISTAMRASSAVPAIFQPKLIDGMCLVDGGVTDVVPVDLLIAAGEPNVLAVDLSENYPMKPDANILDVCTNSLSVLMGCLSEYRASGETLMITPQLPESTSVLTFDEMVTCMDAGYKAAKELMPKIKRLFTP
ncbi:NTE family protein [Sporobacter termitidis DSM 10068]|uniref:NTE family protein n=1 Tax=Sporobacter termitidis DSM 10068 TaxID=1123282 RepID=A0A1M5TWV6_9FIRM|nr:patatin-like phospholipase family protein [Sporobacter termitidis]SHH55277.1 NTE family protein [Sporobacter termitidis DSM 10068]